MKPPDYIISAAKRGLELLAAGHGGDGLTEGTKDAARQLAAGEVSDDKIVRANAWAARHAVDLQAGKNSNPDHKEWPGAGAVAHYLWGINPLWPGAAREWFERQSDKIQNSEKDFMKTMDQSSYFTALSANPAVNPKTGTIKSVSLISVGPARGHFDVEGRQVMVDATTCRQVFDFCLEAGTIKVKIDHGSGVFSIAGWVDNFALSANKVLADLHLYESEKERARVFEIASTNPTHLGISLEFNGQDEVSGNFLMARCDEVMTAALVSDPAANKSLYQAEKNSKKVVDLSVNPTNLTAPQTKQNQTNMKTDPTKTELADYVDDPKKDMAEDAAGEDKEMTSSEMSTEMKKLREEFNSFVSKYAEDCADPKATDPDTAPKMAAQDDKKELSAQLKHVANMAAAEAIKNFSAKMGTNLPTGAGAGSNVVVRTPSTKTFQSIVDEETKNFAGDAVKAMLHCIKKYPTEYKFSRNVGDK